MVFVNTGIILMLDFKVVGIFFNNIFVLYLRHGPTALRVASELGACVKRACN